MFFTTPAIESGWYAQLAKPAFNPPSWVFAPAWLTLYTLMGISFYIIWLHQERIKDSRLLIGLFLMHLALNFLWSIFFFGLKNPFIAFLDISVLWIMILALATLFYRARKIAGWLLVPYFLWVTFAGVLNLSIWLMNQSMI